MRRRRFLHLLEIRGADLRRWPDDERQAARALLTIDPRACAAHDAAARLDALLDHYDPAAAPVAEQSLAARRVAASLAVLPPPRVTLRGAMAEFWWELRALPRVGTLVAVVLLGFVVGLTTAELMPPGVRDFSLMLFEPSPSDWLQL